MQFEWNWFRGWKSLCCGLGLGLILASARVPVIRADEPPPWLFRGKPGGGREESSDGRFCAISPIPNDYLLASRPKFIWQGSVSQLEILSEHEDEILWRHVPSADRGKSYGIATSAVSLLPEQWYVLRLFDASGQVAYSERFYVASDRQQLAVNGIEDSGDPAQALALAKELSEQDYWSDAMGILFSIPESEGLVAQYRQAVSDRYCPE